MSIAGDIIRTEAPDVVTANGDRDMAAEVEHAQGNVNDTRDPESRSSTSTAAARHDLVELITQTREAADGVREAMPARAG
ncbi:hypothetical protein HII36_06435 [Nonomuraea sp. NN258]|uniref:hypothetical protein n=1 Tax=Nonomuraea antri TaxID=2730852 RepID=UPI001569CBF5|nr:hypothetical protein [Nonomuraea antri]NRQ31478.1 hypothetical protein [Nonomuraea antri]